MVQHIFLNKYGLLLSLLSLPQLHAFSFPSTFPLHNHHNHLHRVTTFVSTKRFSSPPKKDEYIYNQIELHKQQEQQEQQQTDVVRSPLRFLGPGYPTIPLRFPHLATSSQRSRNITGVSLDFVLDTAANTNTINAQVAKELELEKVGEAPGGVSAGGGMVGGDTFLLGECELDLSFGREFFKGMVDESESDGDESYDDSNGEEDEAQDHEKEKREEFIFMQGLTASALPVASPAAAGLLSLAFFHCFEGGVEFHWGTPTNSIGENKNNDTAIIPPSITFYGSSQHLNLDGMTRIPFESLPVSMLPSVTLNINGVEIPALFDTGSPITVLNARAAEAVGINTCIPLDELDPTLKKQSSSSGSPWNPFDKLAKSVKSASKIAEATARGNILAIAGSDGRPVRLVKSLSPLEVRLATFSAQEDNASDDTCSSSVTLGQKNVYIGDLPGLAALGGLGGDSAPPAAVLGMDLIRCATRVVFRAQQNEIYI